MGDGGNPHRLCFYFIGENISIMTKTLAEARVKWKQTIREDGGHCPCCDRWGKIYPRHFNNTMARSLMWLAKQNDWCDVPNMAPREIVRSNQLPTTRWWGLCERQTSDDSGSKHSGWWRVTDKGYSFACGITTIPKTAYTYNGDVLGFDDDLIHIKDTFKTKFDYEKVMMPIGPVAQLD